MFRKIIFFTLMFIMLSNLHADKMRIAIMDIQPIDVSKNTARAVSDLIRTELFNTGYFRVVERSEMKSILKEQGFQMSGCTDTECAVQMGRLLSARKILVGSVSKLGKSFIINARIVDVEKGEMEFGEKAKAKDEDNLDIAVEEFARKIAGRIRAKKTGEKPEPYIPEESGDEKAAGKGISFMRKASFGLMGAGLISGGITYIFHRKVNNAYDDYHALTEENTAGWTPEEWDNEWDKVESAQSTRNTFLIIAAGAGGAGLIMFVVDYFFMDNDKGVALKENNKGIHFAFHDKYRLGYTYRW